MGHGDDPDLGRLLMRLFLHTIVEAGHVPDKVVLYNTGVFLMAEGSPVLEDLGALVKAGADVGGCGTCLKRYDLMGRVAVGRVSNMGEIAAALMSAEKVVTP